jgi:hypothetical protein
VPGVTRKSAPASIDCSICLRVSTVPAPMMMSGNSRFNAANASSAAGVRKVSSMLRSPPVSRASASRFA